MARLAGLIVASLACAGCSFTITQSHIASGEPPLCAPSRHLGRIAVLPETVWRADQKDVGERTEMAMKAIRRAFTSACGDDVDIGPLAPWSSELERRRLDALDAAGIDTAVFVRVEELGPTVAVTFSLPLLWVGTSEAQLRLRAIHIPTSRVLLDTAVERVRGGPFQLRPPSWAEPELEAALDALLRTPPP